MKSYCCNQVVGRVNRLVKLKNPCENTYKTNWDVSLDTQNNNMGLKIAIRDANGEVIASFCNNERDISSTLIAKIKELWQAIQLSAEVSLSVVTFERDAKKVISEVNNIEDNWALYDQLIEDIKSFNRGKIN